MEQSLLPENINSIITRTIINHIQYIIQCSTYKYIFIDALLLLFYLFCTRYEILLRMQGRSCNLCTAFHR